MLLLTLTFAEFYAMTMETELKFIFVKNFLGQHQLNYFILNRVIRKKIQNMRI